MDLGSFFRRTKPVQQGDEGPEEAIGIQDEPPATDLDDISGLLASFEARGLEVFRRFGLPSVPGAYRRSPSGDWQFLAASMEPSERWRVVLERTPEEGWRYAKLAEVGRQTMPHQREVMAAVCLLEAVEEARRETMDASGGIVSQSGSALKAGMRLVLALEASARFSREKLYASPIRDGDGDFSAANLLRRNRSEERQRLWKIWRTEAAEIRRLNPDLGSRAVALRLKKRLGLQDSIHTIRRRIMGIATSGLTGDPTDDPSRSTSTSEGLPPGPAPQGLQTER